MARTKGSDDLYRLIHSLTTEEKGYFKKFAKRHSAEGNIHLDLFDAVNLQGKFEEDSLKKKFNGYAVKKVYLKEMITDSLVLYYRSTHDHVQLLNQAQKVHILLSKGLYIEAGKILEKALEESGRMELFAMQRYFLRIQAEVSSYNKGRTIKGAYEFCKNYRTNMDKNNELELNLTTWELNLFEENARGLGKDVNYLLEEKPDMGSCPALSVRSEMRKLWVRNFQETYQMQWVESYTTSKELVAKAEKFKKLHDNSFNSINSYIRHAGGCLPIRRYKESVAYIDRLMKIVGTKGFYADVAFVYGTPFKITALDAMGKSEEALQLAENSEKKMILLAGKLKDENSLRHFLFTKLVLLFVSGKYAACWQQMQSIQLKRLVENFPHHFLDYTLLQLMTQQQMQHYDIAIDIAGKSKKAFKKHGLNDYTATLMLDFFCKANEQNRVKLAKETLERLNKYYEETKTGSRLLFGKMKCTYWLEEISGGKTIVELKREKLNPATKKELSS